jgi:hypothetical protein
VRGSVDRCKPRPCASTPPTHGVAPLKVTERCVCGGTACFFNAGTATSPASLLLTMFICVRRAPRPVSCVCGCDGVDCLGPRLHYVPRLAVDPRDAQTRRAAAANRKISLMSHSSVVVECRCRAAKAVHLLVTNASVGSELNHSRNIVCTDRTDLWRIANGLSRP